MLRKENLLEDLSQPCAISSEAVSLKIDSHGSEIYGRILLPARMAAEERTPAVLLLHGFPGWEKNLDAAYALCRTGIACAYFSYRGVWGSHGDYSFTHILQDAETLLSHLRENAERYAIDPEHIYLVGHSMGGFAALHTAVSDGHVRGAIMIAPCDIAQIYLDDPATFTQLMDRQRSGYLRLAAPDTLATEVVQNVEKWRFLNAAPQLPAHIPVHLIGAAKDEVTPPALNILPLHRYLAENGRPTSYTEVEDGHNFISHRITLIRLIYDRIAQMEQT